MGEVQRWVRWYKADGDAMVGEAELRDADIEFLRRLVYAPPGDPLYDCWPVAACRLGELAGFGPVPAASAEVVYILEADAEPGAAADGGT